MASPGDYTIRSDAPYTVMGFPQTLDYLFVNKGPSTIYLGDLPGVNASNGSPLAANQSKRWEAGYPCYAITANNETSILNVTPNPGDLTGPDIDPYNSLLPNQQDSVLVPAGVLTTLLTQADVSSYKSVLLSAIYVSTNAAIHTVRLEWFSKTGLSLYKESFVNTPRGSSSIYYTFPVRGAKLTATLDANSTSIATYSALGSRRIVTIVEGYRSNILTASASTFVESINQPFAALETIDFVPEFAHVGRYTMNVTNFETTSRSIRIQVIQSLAYRLVHQTVTIAASDSFYREFIMPPGGSAIFRITNLDAVSGATIGLTVVSGVLR